MGIRKVIKMYDMGNVSVCGLRGSGKDMLQANVIVRRKKPYISNMNYGGDYYPLDFNKLDCGKNSYLNFISGNVNYYEFPYPKGTDVYISDCGLYFPSQYCSELNNKFKYLPTFFALSRQLGQCNVHQNAQALQRVWDKIREQSELYIRCRWCKVFFGKIVVQKVTLYDKYQSCVDRVEPCRVRKPLFANREQKLQYDLYIDKFFNSYGDIKNKYLIYINKSNYDTYHFEKLLKGGV